MNPANIAETSSKGHLLFATGGTGGHIFPALAIAKEAQKRNYHCSFIGHKNGMEARLIPEHGFSFYGVNAGKLDRQRPNPLEAFKVMAGLSSALKIVRKLEPSLVIGFGGFASFPGIAAARLLAKAYVLHETNAFPGLVTRWFAGKARMVATSQLDTYTHLPSYLEQHVVGHPVREERVPKLEARKALGLPEKGLITYVSGGSQGSLRLNEAVPKAFKALSEKPIVLHSTGERHLQSVEAETKSLANYYTRSFVNATLAWSAADLAITRAGFGTLAEAAFHAVPSIMVPLPTAAENHQWHNANAVQAAGAGWLLEEAQLASLSKVWQDTLTNEQLQRAAQAAQTRSPQGASTAFMDLLETLTPRPNAQKSMLRGLA